MSSPPQASLIRAKLNGATTAQLRIRMRHEMESGQRRDELGRPIPARHITDFTLTLNGKTVLAGQFGASVSKDPFLELGLRGVKAGDTLVLSWTDSTGAKRSDSATVQAA